MKREEFLKKIEEISVWSDGDKRAPHKPLSVLYALGQFNNGVTDIDFNDFDKVITKALKSTMPSKKAWHSHYPFWYLKTDGIWDIRENKKIKFREGKSEPLKSELKNNHIHAGFSEDSLQTLKKNPDLVAESAKLLLDTHFPESLHTDILQLVGLDISFMVSRRRKRDSAFRDKIMQAYSYRCALCGYGIRLKDATIGLEAAHIKWHQAGGPDIEQNGLALCATHHVLFDKGAYTIAKNLEVYVSESVDGANFDRVLFDYHGKQISEPKALKYAPSEIFLAWHYKEVFVPSAREVKT